MNKRLITACLAPVFIALTVAASDPAPKPYENWPADDQEWNTLTNHIMWCYNSLRDRECVATGHTNNFLVTFSDRTRGEAWEPSLVCPFRDYSLIAREIDNLAPYFVNHTLAGANGDFSEYFSTTNANGRCPTDFPRWTPDSLHSNAFGRTKWSTDSALTSWMAVTNRAFISEVTKAINFLKWTSRHRDSSGLPDNVPPSGWWMGADHAVSEDSFTSDYEELSADYFASWASTETGTYSEGIDVGIYVPDPRYYNPEPGTHIYMSCLYYYRRSIDTLQDSDILIDGFFYPNGKKGNPYDYKPKISLYLRKTISWSGYTPSAAVVGRRNVFFCEYLGEMEEGATLVSSENSIAADALQLDPGNYSELDDPLIYGEILNRYPFVPASYREGIGCPLWLINWTFEEFPEDKLPSAAPIETPDVDVDGIVETMPVDGLPGSETGTFVVNPADESPCLYLPLSYEAAWNSVLPVHAYLSQGAATNLPFHYMPWTTKGSSFPVTIPDCRFPLLGLNKFHYSLNTCILEFSILTNAQKHIKQAVVLRPRGEVVVFDFPWDGNSSCFSNIGYPTGINRDRGYVLYHERDDGSDNSSTWGALCLLFPSGIGHQFEEDWYTSFSRPTSLNKIFNEDGISTSFSAQPGEWLDELFDWGHAPSTQEVACVTGCVYRTTVKWEKGLPTHVTYHSLRTGELCESVTLGYSGSRAVQMDKLDLESGAKVQVDKSILYGTGVKRIRQQTGTRDTGRTVTVKTFDDAGATTPYLTETCTYDNRQRLSKRTLAAGGQSVSSDYTYKNETVTDERYPETGLLVRNSVATLKRNGSFGAVTETYNYELQLGWPSLVSCSQGGDDIKESILGYYSVTNNYESLRNSHLRIPLRGVSLSSTDRKWNGKSFNKEMYTSSGNNYIKVTEVCHETNAVLGATGNHNYTNSFCNSGFEYYSPLPGGGYSFEYWSIIHPTYYKSPSSEETITSRIPNILTNVITEVIFNIADESTSKYLLLNARGVPLRSTTHTRDYMAKLEETITDVDGRGRPTKTQFMDGTSVSYQNYCVHGPQTIINRDLSITTIKYDSFGRVKKRVDGVTGITYEYEYDPNGNVTKQTRSVGAKRAESSATYGLDGPLLYSKDESGHEVTITGQRNNGYLELTRTETGKAAVTNTYWADGTLKSVTGAGASAKIDRDRGVTDNKYWVKTSNQDNANEWSTQWYQYNGLFAYTEQPDGKTSSVAYDEKLRPKSGLSADSVKSLASYDAKYPWLPSVSGVSLGGQALDLSSDPYCVSNSYAFTAQGLTTTQYSFPEDNSATAFKDSSMQVSLDGRTGSFEVQGRTGSFSCDAAPSTGTYTKTVNLPSGGIATYTYSKFLLREETMRVTGSQRKVTKTYKYDDLRRLKSYTTDERGFNETVTVIRDPAKGLVSNINSSSRGSTSVIRENDKVKQITTPAGTTTFEWKGNGSIDSVQQLGGPKFSRQEDAYGRDTSVTRQNDSISSSLGFTYGNDGGFAGKTRDGVQKMSVDVRRADGRPKVVNLPDGIIVTTDFDGAGRETGQTWTDPTNASATVAFTYYWMRDGSLRRHAQTEGGPCVSNSVTRSDGCIASDTCTFGCGTLGASVQTSYDTISGTPSLVSAGFNGFTSMNLAAAAAHDAFGNLYALSGAGFTNIFSCAVGGLVTNTLTAVPGGVQLSRSVIWSAQAGKPARVEYTLNGQFLRRWQYAFTNGLIASVSRSGGDGYCTAYTYDNARQLLGATSSTTNGQALAGLTFAYDYSLAGDTSYYGHTALRHTAYENLDDLQTFRIWSPYVHLLGRMSASNASVAAYTSYSTNLVPATVVDGLYYSAPEVDIPSDTTPMNGVATVIATPPGGTAETARVAFSLPCKFEHPSYNGRGMILSDSRRHYTWDAAGRLLSITNSGVSNAVKVAFQYYPDGRRALKTVSCFTNNAWTVTRSLHYVWQGWKLAAECERDGVGTVTAVRHFVWGPDIAGQQSASLESEAEGVGGLLLIREWKPGRGMKQYLPLTDGLGNICGLIDATDGSLAAEYDYDPYGGPVIERGVAAAACPFRHRTRYYDSESWLYYYGYRYYDPSTTKWISKDPLGEAGGWNLTCFCSNDPVNKVDPLGLADLRNHVFVGDDALRELGIELSAKDYESFARGLMLPDVPFVDVNGIASGRAEIPVAVLMTLKMEMSKITKQVTESVKQKKKQLQQLYPILDWDDFRRWMPVAMQQIIDRAAEPGRRTAYWWGDSGIMGPVLTRVPKLRNTRTVRTHFDDLTYYHGMGDSGGSAAELNDNIQTTVQTCLNEFTRLRQTDPSRAYLNLGIAIHILTDTWTPSHVTRNENGTIRLFQDYNAQSLHYHARNDNLIENVPKSYAAAVKQSAQMIRLATGSGSVDESNFFNLAPGGRIGIVPGTGYVTFWETLWNGIPGGNK